MANQITYQNKLSLVSQAGVAEVNKVTAANMNEIKSRYNELVTAFNTIVSRLGIAENATDWGTFSGTTISDNLTTLKLVLDEIEAAIESISGGSTNLSIANRDDFTLDILSSSGTDVTIPAATASLSGLMASIDKAKLATIEDNAKDDQNASEVPINVLPINYTPSAQNVEGHLIGIDSALASSGVADDSITNQKLFNMAEGTIKARVTAGTGDPEDVTFTLFKAAIAIVPGDISGFDTSVSANTDVAANTAERHTHTNSAVLDGITDAGSGVIISGAERTNISNNTSKLSGIEAGADVTDETNVVSSLNGATLAAATVAGTDKVLVQDADDADNLKTVTAQSIADLGVGGGGVANPMTADLDVGGFKITSSGGGSIEIDTSLNGDIILNNGQIILDKSNGNVSVGESGDTAPVIGGKLVVAGNIISDFRDATERIIGFTGFGGGDTGIFRFGDSNNQLETTNGGPMILRGFNGHQIFNNAGQIAEIGLAAASTDSLFLGGLVVNAPNNSTTPATALEVRGAITGQELSADPANPAEGKWVIWQSNGNGSGDDGDIMVKITAGGVTKTVTLVDFSTV